MPSQPYSPDHYPPLPVLAVLLRTADFHTGPHTALLDTGADVTMVPTPWLEDIGALESEQVRVRGPFGEAHHLQRYLVDIEVADLRLPGLYVVGDDYGQDLILGRDVLNKLALWLDGPRQSTTILDDATLARLRRS